MMMLLAAHQPDLLPWSGFFWKMENCDVFDLAIYDAYSHQGYHRRTKMGPTSEWVSLKLHRASSQGRPLCEVKYDHEESEWRVKTAMRQHYADAPYLFRTMSELSEVFDRQVVDSDGNARLSALNTALILWMRERLKITTEVSVMQPLEGSKTAGLIELCWLYGADQYLSGAGGRAYVDEAEMRAAGIEVSWSRHEPVSGNSMIEAMCMLDNPREVLRP